MQDIIRLGNPHRGKNTSVPALGKRKKRLNALSEAIEGTLKRCNNVL
jgi:hypothetical protein